MSMPTMRVSGRQRRAPTTSPTCVLARLHVRSRVEGYWTDSVAARRGLEHPKGRDPDGGTMVGTFIGVRVASSIRKVQRHEGMKGSRTLKNLAPSVALYIFKKK